MCVCVCVCVCVCSQWVLEVLHTPTLDAPPATAHHPPLMESVEPMADHHNTPSGAGTRGPSIASGGPVGLSGYTTRGPSACSGGPPVAGNGSLFMVSRNASANVPRAPSMVSMLVSH